MPATPEEIKKRELTARAAIKREFDVDTEEVTARLFVSHHLTELDSSYWSQHFSAKSPSPSLILAGLVLRSHWGGNDEVEIFDFTLPGEVTDYVLSVKFDEAGNIEEVSMES